MNIVFENSFFLILDKPAGLSVHNSSPSLLEMLQKQKKSIHFVNRLDQQTSGLVVVAQKPDLHQSLSHALQQGQKTYQALLRGSLGSPQSTVTWSLPLSDKAEGRKNPQGVSRDRKPCLTTVEIVRESKFFTEIKATIQTGRQHQIRKHAALSRHAIVGDQRYNDPKYNQKIESLYKASSRMYLHAQQLCFYFQQKKFLFESPPLNLDIFWKESSCEENP